MTEHGPHIQGYEALRVIYPEEFSKVEKHLAWMAQRTPRPQYRHIDEEVVCSIVIEWEDAGRAGGDFIFPLWRKLQADAQKERAIKESLMPHADAPRSLTIRERIRAMLHL
jgi:hypothetical protein